MPRRKSRKQAKSTTAAIVLFFRAIAAAVSTISLATVTYYRWAAKITHPKRRVAVCLIPVCLMAVLAILGWAAMPAESTFETATRPAPQTMYEFNNEFDC